MTITKYQNYFDKSVAGQVATTEISNIKTRSAQDIILFGRGVVQGTSAGNNVRNVKQSKASITYSADFVASNSIPMTINGLSITPVVFATSHAATFAALIAAIDGLTGISAVAGTGREIIITVDGASDNITLSNTTVTGGASQPTTTIVYSSLGVFEGIATIRHGQPTTVGGDDRYEINDPINVLTKGTIWVEVVANVNYGDTVYLYADKTNATNQGQFTNFSSGNILVASARFLDSAIASTSLPALVRIEINQP